MNPFPAQTDCPVCGGPGVSSYRDAWSADRAHSDPRVCADYLAERERKLAKREAALDEREAVPA